MDYQAKEVWTDGKSIPFASYHFEQFKLIFQHKKMA